MQEELVDHRSYLPSLVILGHQLHAGGPGGRQETGRHGGRVSSPRQPRISLFQQGELQGKTLFVP